MKKSDYVTLATLANSVELGAAVLCQVAGNEISDTVAGNQLKEVAKDTLTAKINQRLIAKGAKQ